ncbi:uncharacterized protein LOC124144554 isoform X1 [Haliotis rufescens]|uniref:uncharacterized protein LOC124144554 isoform X1 n=1 Tax=Haliotis rufescens TaxID=6454 RepID=UPI00201EDFC2|nr:uncharacterized protein LOC124144554 isoform X1 [Haliotis rufescens]
MELLYLSTFATIFCTIFVFSLKYLSLLRWISGRAYVLRQNQEKVTAEEVLDLIKNAKPFPVSCQKGWKIHCYVHDHRLWFHFLTIPNSNTASLKVFAVFSKLRASSQSVLQLLKDVSMTCEWKPGVVATSYVRDVSSHDVPVKSKGVPPMPVKQDVVREERVCQRPSRPFDAWWQPNITQTTTEEYRRLWHREDNGCCWLLQMNEKRQAWTFFLAQPVEGWFEVDQSLVTIVTWSSGNDGNESGEMAAATLGSLREFLHLRKMQATPLLTLSLPRDISAPSFTSSTPKSDEKELKTEGKKSHKLITKFKSFIEKTAQSNNASKVEAQKEEIKKYSSILKFGSSASEKVETEVVGNTVCPEETPQGDQAGSEEILQDCVSDKKTVENGKQPLQRSVSDSAALRQVARRKNSQTQNIPEVVMEQACESTDPALLSKYKTLASQAAAELLAQVLKASNIELDKGAEEQFSTAGGWMFYGFESDVVILKRLFKAGSHVQSYLGKGVVEAPPQTVWEALRNPRTRFTYDESLKKVDILQTISENLRIVYLYHEVHQILKKESCDFCIVQSERIEGEKHILVYQSVDWATTPPRGDTVRATLLPSGWIIEPVQKDKKIHSMVTYLMQIDCGAPKPTSEKMPFEDMVTKQPLSITFLQQYLQPAVMLARRQSLPSLTNS